MNFSSNTCMTPPSKFLWQFIPRTPVFIVFRNVSNNVVGILSGIIPMIISLGISIPWWKSGTLPTIPLTASKYHSGSPQENGSEIPWVNHVEIFHFFFLQEFPKTPLAVQNFCSKYSGHFFEHSPSTISEVSSKILLEIFPFFFLIEFLKEFQLKLPTKFRKNPWKCFKLISDEIPNVITELIPSRSTKKD